MFRPPSLPPALVAVAVSALAAGTLLAAPAGALPGTAVGQGEVSAGPAAVRHGLRARRAADETPLAVDIEALTPSYVPRRGPIRVTGSVTNNDSATWRDINTYAFISASPMRSTAELAEASRVDEQSDVGGRITERGSYDTLDRLDPGESAQFSIRVPRAALPVTEAGVYWFGIHALGAGPEGRVDGADGRARTFMPLVPTTGRATDTALVLPLRRRTTWAADGRVQHESAWARTLSSGGRLRSLVDFGASAGSRPLTWLLDPGLPDVVRSLALGNEPRPLSLPPGDEPSESPSPSPTESSDSSTGESTSGTTDPLGDAGSTWLDRLHEALAGNQVLALPYGDVDVAATVGQQPGLYDRARHRSGRLLDPWDLPMSPAIGSPTGFLPTGAIAATHPNTTILVTDRMFPGEVPPVARTAGARLVPTSSGAASGGPGPGPRLTALALRQRILSEAAVRVLAPGRQPLVAVLPQRWLPTVTTGFFEGLDVPWVHLTTVAGATDRKGRAVPADSLEYPPREMRDELGPANLAAGRSLIEAGRTLQNVLVGNDGLASMVTDEALGLASYGSRRHPVASRIAADRSRSWIEGQLRSVTISAPPSVTLSSARGRFATTIENGLDVPVSVSVQPFSDGSLTLSVPERIDVAPGGRTTVLLTASARTPGIHNVRLTVTDRAGTPLGASVELPVRYARVSGVIWLILGTGVGLLFVAIAVRLVRRIRAAARAARAGRA